MEAEKSRLLKQVFNEPERHAKALKTFQETYEGLLIGGYTNDVLRDVIDNGTAKIQLDFKSAALSQVERSGITSPLLKANLIKGCDEVMEQFNQSLEGLMQSAIAVNKKADFDRATSKQMTVKGLFVAANCIRHIYPAYKILQIGRVPGGLVTKCNKSFDLDSSTIRVDDNGSIYYMYAKWPRSGGLATLLVSSEPKENTEQHLYIFWQSGSFHDIKF